MKKLNNKIVPLFGMKALAQAVTLGGLMLMVGEASANTGGATSNQPTLSSLNALSYSNIDGDEIVYQTIGDLEIYQAAQAGSAGLLMMFDMSGSMNWCKSNADLAQSAKSVTYYIKPQPGNRGIETKEIKIGGKDVKIVSAFTNSAGQKVDVSRGIPSVEFYCSDNSPNRITILKRAMLEMLAEGMLDRKHRLGLAAYSTPRAPWAASIHIPVKELNVEHRYDLMREITALRTSNATPSAHAFAEAGAYMLGTSTVKSTGQAKELFVAENVLMKRTFDNYTPRRADGLWKFPNSCVNTTGALSLLSTVGNRQGWVACSPNHTLGAYTSDEAGFQSTWLQSGNANNIDTRYLGKITAVYSEKDKKTYEFEDGKLPANLEQLVGPELREDKFTAQGWDGRYYTYTTQQREIALGNKVRYKDIDTTTSYKHSGFPVSHHDTKTEDLTKYQSPISASGCDGYGIYFLTDGVPNQNSAHINMMAHSLQNNSKMGKPNNNSTGAGSSGQILRSLAGNHPVLHTEDTKNENGAVVTAAERGWDYMGVYARILRDPENNTVGTPIKTATVGFGPEFAARARTKTYTTTKSDGTVVTQEIIDCDSYTQLDVKNLCKLGGLGYGYGEGGFTATSEAKAISASVQNFLDSLGSSISTRPTGTISVPKDPLSVTNIQPYAYLPMLEPRITESPATWRGNLKKYHTLNGTLYGANKQRLYEKATNPTTENRNYPSQFNTKTTDIWQTGNGNGGSIEVGGTKEKLKQLQDGNKTSRLVYLENYKTFDIAAYEKDRVGYMKTVEKDKELVKFGVQNGALVGLDKLKAPYTVDDKKHLIRFLGIQLDNPDAIDTDAKLVTAVRQALANNKFASDRVLGGVAHSVPVLASYKGEFEDNGAITSDEKKRDDTLLYGSMDGALHMVEARSGEERFAFIPRAIFEDSRQREALINKDKDGITGTPVFGMDAPWTVYGDYVYDLADGNSDKTSVVRAKRMYAFGGMRMGGNGIFGLDISAMRKPITNIGEKEDATEFEEKDSQGNLVKVKREPKLLFSINRYTPGFERLGNTWSKPLVAKIKTGKKPTDVRDVLIFGGGYDMCYEHPKFKVGLEKSTHNLNATGEFSQFDSETACKKEVARGNAVYMVDMKTGKLIASWTGETYPDMKDSVVGEITTLDRNNNGAVDHLYFADLGGKVFRVDLKEGVNPVGAVAGTDPDIKPVTSTITRRLVKVLDANKDKEKDPNHTNYRFYDQPLVSFYDHIANGKKITFAVVNIASGDRSSPVHTHRDADGTGEIKDANRIFGFFDRDLASTRLDYKNPTLITQDLTVEDLVHIEPARIDSGSKPGTVDASGKVTGTPNAAAVEYLDRLQKAVESETKTKNEGWWYTMDRFDGLVRIPSLKSIGTGMVTGNVYYANIYSPHYEYTTSATCEARVSGGTERQLYCLPWGICAVPNGKENERGVVTTENGVLGYLKAGPGIQELALGTVTNREGQSTPFRTILGQQSLKEVSEAAKNTTRRTHQGGDSSALARLPTTAKPQGGEGTGSDGNGQPLITAPQYTLAIQRWYDLQNEKQN